jgi:hypothetical protein
MTLVKRIIDAKDKAELDRILDELTPDQCQLLEPELLAHPPDAEARREGHESPGDALQEIGTQNGNRFYALEFTRRLYSAQASAPQRWPQQVFGAPAASGEAANSRYDEHAKKIGSIR